MDNKEFIAKSSEIFESFKENVRKCSALNVSAYVSLVTAGGAALVNTTVASFKSEMTAYTTGVATPMAVEAVNFNIAAGVAGVAIAGATYSAVLVAKWAMNVNDKLKELEAIKLEGGGIAEKPSVPTGPRGAVKLTEAELAQRVEDSQSSAKNELSPLDAFYKSHGYTEHMSASSGANAEKASERSKNTLKMG